MTSHSGTVIDSTLPIPEQWWAWPAAWYSYWLTLQLEYLNELAKPLALPPWMAWYNGAEQLA